jgi:hypothetical protein
LLETLKDREDQGVFLRGIPPAAPSASSFASRGFDRVAKPRPPCVIIIAN